MNYSLNRGEEKEIKRQQWTKLSESKSQTDRKTKE